MRLRFTFFTLLFAASFILKAQEMGVHTGIAFITNAKFNPTLGLHWDDKLKNESIQYGFNLHAPIKFDSDKEWVDAINPTFSRAELRYNDKVNMLDLYFLYRYFIWGKSREAGGLLALGGATLGFAYSKLVPGYYDPAVYKLNAHFSDLTRFYVQPCINLGVGYDLELKNKNLLGFQLPVYFNFKKVTHTPLDNASEDHALTVVSLRATYTLSGLGKVDHNKDEKK